MKKARGFDIFSFSLFMTGLVFCVALILAGQNLPGVGRVLGIAVCIGVMYAAIRVWQWDVQTTHCYRKVDKTLDYTLTLRYKGKATVVTDPNELKSILKEYYAEKGHYELIVDPPMGDVIGVKGFYNEREEAFEKNIHILTPETTELWYGFGDERYHNDYSTLKSVFKRKPDFAHVIQKPVNTQVVHMQRAKRGLTERGILYYADILTLQNAAFYTEDAVGQERKAFTDALRKAVAGGREVIYYDENKNRQSITRENAEEFIEDNLL